MTIRQKMWTSLGTVLLLLLGVVIIAQSSLNSTRDQLDRVIKGEQPKLLHTMSMAQELYQSASALGSYTLSQTPRDRETYRARMHDARNSLTALRDHPAYHQQPSFRSEVDKVGKLIRQISALHQQMFELADNPQKNLPALGLATMQLEPVGSTLSQLISDMILAEEDERGNNRRELNLNMHNLRYYWSMVHSNVRSYLAFRGEQARADIKLYLNGAQQSLEKLERNTRLLNEDQTDSFDEFLEYQQEYQNILDQVLTLHSGDEWRKDNYLMRTSLAPLLQQLDQSLEMMVNEAQSAISSTQTELKSNIADTLAIVYVLLLAGIGIGCCVIWLSNQQIIKPIVGLRDILRDISEGSGDLTKRIDIQSNDELGQMSQHFNQVMENQRAMISDIKSVARDVDQQAQDSGHRLEQVADNISQSNNISSDNVIQANAMSELSATVAEHSSSTTEVVKKSVSSAETAAMTMNLMASQATKVANNINQLHEFVLSLSGTSQRMMSMIDVIRGIADQTNLLALRSRPSRRSWPWLCCGCRRSASTGFQDPAINVGNCRYSQRELQF